MGEEYPSPDGKYILYLSCNEVRMSHWICQPELVEAESKLTLYKAEWGLDASEIKWSEDNREVRFFLRKYPGTKPGKYVRLLIADGKATLADES